MNTVTSGAQVFTRIEVLARVVGLVLLFVAMLAITGMSHGKFNSLGAALLGLIVGICLLAGVASLYVNYVDWRHLRLIQAMSSGEGKLQDGQRMAFQGVVQISGEPLRAPFSARPCAAYHYDVQYIPRGQGSTASVSHKYTVAEGMHMAPTYVRGTECSLKLASFPRVELALYQSFSSGEGWLQTQALIRRIKPGAGSMGDVSRGARLLTLQRGSIDHVGEDYFHKEPGSSSEFLYIVERRVPADETVCVIGTYDQAAQALSGRGGGLMVYRGDAAAVLARVGEDVFVMSRIALLMLAIAAVMLPLLISYPAALPQMILGPPPVDGNLPGRTAWTLWGFVIAIPVLLALATLRFARAAEDRDVSVPGRHDVMARSGPGQEESPHPQAEPELPEKLLITHATLRRGAKAAVEKGSPLFSFDGSNYYVNLSAITPGDQQRASDVVTRLQAGTAIKARDTIWLAELLRG